jgi:hypothetical protein
MAKKAKPELDKQARVQLTFKGDLESLQTITTDAYEQGATRVVFEHPEGSDEGTLDVFLEGNATHIVSVAYDLNRRHL